jgi:nucleoid-associated protein YgaU
VKRKVRQKKLKGVLKNLKLNEKSISRILGALVLLIIGFLIFNYFKGVREEVASPKILTEELAKQAGEVKLIEEEGKIIPEGLPTEYVIQKGDDLWKVAEKFYSSGYNWVDLAQANSLKDPNLIGAGQKLTIPKAEVKKPTVVQAEKLKADQPISEDTYQVQKSDHLWEIALRAYGDGYQWVKIAQANELTNPNIIHPGNNLTIPR